VGGSSSSMGAAAAGGVAVAGVEGPATTTAWTVTAGPSSSSEARDSDSPDFFASIESASSCNPLRRQLTWIIE